MGHEGAIPCGRGRCIEARAGVEAVMCRCVRAGPNLLQEICTFLPRKVGPQAARGCD
ncbi:hypothetical protein AIOL_003373 [Candidatus Rhodobacter oscarellae]|uniref:Uncharacterized protein n=1 Tax=Candidatus Rhodobacter oscarellae TaxID=1675527 RepID=A0A0J9E6K1_9RHOB|nr:hypothetical protein AIOL_003373 [Candidatus Rhodobacter lobularis]